MQVNIQDNDELLDLVDSHDHVIGSLTRKEAHENPKYIHREVGIILHNSANEILFQKRSSLKRYPGMWVISAGGHIPAGQNPLNQAHEELKEELGFDTDIYFIKKEFESGNHETHFVYWYKAKYKNQQMIINSNEIEEIKFISRNTLLSIFKGFDPVSYTQPFWQGHSVLAFSICKYFWSLNQL